MKQHFFSVFRCEEEEVVHSDPTRKTSDAKSTCSSGYESACSSRKTSFDSYSRKSSTSSLNGSCSRKTSASSYGNGCSRKSSTSSIGVCSRKSSLAGGFLSFGPPSPYELSAAMSAAGLAHPVPSSTGGPTAANNNNDTAAKNLASHEELRLLKLMEDANR